ncbi:transmembrane protein 230 [Salvia divinorum]|uniref:Transmembrane protein 230 n=1 Tax=Salvia divinorum TaxID=28513 RepID=A0ABD1HR71_SALDI
MASRRNVRYSRIADDDDAYNNVFIFTGHMGGELSQAYGLLGLGLLTFVPGFYETRIAYYSWRGAQGYRFANIPDY